MLANKKVSKAKGTTLKVVPLLYFNSTIVPSKYLTEIGSLTVGYQKKVPAGRIKPAFFVSNFWFLSIVFYCNVL